MTTAQHLPNAKGVIYLIVYHFFSNGTNSTTLLEIKDVLVYLFTKKQTSKQVVEMLYFSLLLFFFFTILIN